MRLCVNTGITPRVIFPRERLWKAFLMWRCCNTLQPALGIANAAQRWNWNLPSLKRWNPNTCSWNCKELTVIMQVHLMVINIYYFYCFVEFPQTFFILWANFSLFSTKQFLSSCSNLHKSNSDTPVVYPLTWLGISSRSKIHAGKKHYIPARILEHMI